MIRVISGKYRGQKLLVPPSEFTRPTKDMAKEAIFSMIQFTLPGSVVLDVFAGSGSLAIEALSRGAAKAIAIEKNPQVVEVLKKNVANLKITNLDVVKRDAINYLDAMKGLKFDVIFLDPPYQDYELLNQILTIIGNNQLLNNQGYIILETDNSHKVLLPHQLTIQKDKKYGKATIVLITNNI